MVGLNHFLQTMIYRNILASSLYYSPLALIINNRVGMASSKINPSGKCDELAYALNLRQHCVC